MKNRDYDHELTMKNHDWPWSDRVKTVIDHDLTMKTVIMTMVWSRKLWLWSPSDHKNRDYDHGLTMKNRDCMTMFWLRKAVSVTMVWP